MAGPLITTEEQVMEKFVESADLAGQRKEEYGRQNIENVTINILSTLHSGKTPVNEDVLRNLAGMQTRDWLGRMRADGKNPSREDTRARLGKAFTDLYARNSELKIKMERAAKKSIGAGSLFFPEDVVLTEDQQMSIKLDQPYKLTDRQLTTKLLSDGVIPDRLMALFARTPPSQFVEREGVPVALKRLVLAEIDRQYTGAPNKDDTRTNSDGFVAGIPGALISGISMPSESLSSFSGELVSQIATPENLLKIRQTQAPSVEQLQKIDKKHPVFSEGFLPSMAMFSKIGPDKIRSMGLSPEDMKGIDFDVSAAGGSALKRATFQKGNKKLDVELGTIRQAYSLAAKAALRELDKNDPRYERYFGSSHDDRLRRAMSEARDALGEDATKEQIVKATKFQYWHGPEQKMLRDMTAEDKFGEVIFKPDFGKLLHEVTLDPLWVTGPIKAIKQAKWLGRVTKVDALVEKGGAAAVEAALKIPGVSKASLAASENFIKVKNGLSEAFRHYTYHDETITGADKLGKSLGKEAKAGVRVKDMDNYVDDLKLLHQAADDHGSATGRQIATIGGKIRHHLQTLKTPEQKMEMWAILNGMNPEDVAAGTSSLTNRHRKMIPEIRALSDEFYELIKDRGQLNSIVKGTVSTAKKELYYVPRKVVGDLHDLAVKAGFNDLNEAADKLFPADLSAINKALSAAGYRARRGKTIMEVAYKDYLRLLKDPDTAAIAMSKIGKLKPEIFDRFADVAELRGGLTAGHLQQIKKYGEIKGAIDITGSNATHHINPTTGRAIERTELGDGYAWAMDAERQWAAVLGELGYKGAKTAEIKYLAEALGVNHVSGKMEFGNTGLIRTSASFFPKLKGDKRKEMIQLVESAMSQKAGIEMVAIQGELAQKLAPLVLEKGKKFGNSGAIFVPKSFSKRAETLLQVKAADDVGVLRDIPKVVRDWVIRPMNAIYRPTRTILRSPAFHAVNFWGGVGLNVLAHGMRAPGVAVNLGVLGARMAGNSIAGRLAARGIAESFGGNRSALGTMFKLGDGSSLPMGTILKTMDDFGMLHQGQAKYAFDVAAGKGPLAAAARLIDTVGKKTGAQWLASKTDDFQKFGAFAGWLLKHGEMNKAGTGLSTRSLHKGLEFTTKYAGNYNRLTDVEKTLMRELFTFYSWNRFILPHLVRQIFENPQRLAAFEKVRSIIEYNNKHSAPTTGRAVPEFIWKQRGFTAQPHMQPRPGEGAPHEFGMTVLEMPLSSLSVLGGGFRGEHPIEASLGPMGWAIINFLTGMSHQEQRTWEEPFRMPSFDVQSGFHNYELGEGIWETVNRLDRSKGGRFLMESVPLPGGSSQAYFNLARLYLEHGMEDESAEMWLRYRVGRDFMGLDRMAANMLGMEGLSMPTYFEVGGTTLPLPGLGRTYSTKPLHTAGKQQGRTQRKIAKEVR